MGEKRRYGHATARALADKDFANSRDIASFEIKEHPRGRHATTLQGVPHFPGPPRARPSQPRHQISPTQWTARLPRFAAQSRPGRPKIHDGGALKRRATQPKANAVRSEQCFRVGSQLENLIGSENGQSAAAHGSRVCDDQPPIGSLPFLIIAQLFATQGFPAKRFDSPRASVRRKR